VTVQGQLLDMLEAVAAALGDELRARLVFVGGCSTALLISDDNILEVIRATDQVDLIVDLVGRVQWYQLVEDLQAGFTISGEDGPTCRLLLGDLKVDFMPLDGNILGFSNVVKSWV
jgi:NADPH:quinone reductase-like Zn-dependent oxidoreductase